MVSFVGHFPLACNPCCADKTENLQEDTGGEIGDGLESTKWSVSGLVEVVESDVRRPNLKDEQGSPESKRVSAEARRLFEKWKAEETGRRNGTDNGEKAAIDGDGFNPAGKFSGAWEETGQDKGVHTIHGTKLIWSNGRTSHLAFNGEEMKMIYNGSEIEAHLDASGRKVHWGDGDVWRRAGLDGFWKEGTSGNVHTISGETLSISMKSGTVQKEKLVILSPTSFSMTLNNVKHIATLDEVSMALTWSDGDVWIRARGRRA